MSANIDEGDHYEKNSDVTALNLIYNSLTKFSLMDFGFGYLCTILHVVGQNDFKVEMISTLFVSEFPLSSNPNNY